jgi:chromosome segregation ATPase
MNSQIKADQQTTAQQISAVEQKEAQTEAANTELQSDLGVVTKKLRVTQGDLQKARQEAAQIRDDSAQKIADLNTDVTTKLATKASTDDLQATNGTVTGVKTDLEGTKNDLKMARSELGTLIARNGSEIDQLRRMGERDYTEFSITSRNKPVKVGNMTVELRSVDAKKNQFSVVLVVDDVRTENKNKPVNQPIFFYPNGTHQAHEFVVNSVGKDKITGYVSTPKAPVTTTASGF